MVVSIPGEGVLRYFHIYVGSEHFLGLYEEIVKFCLGRGQGSLHNCTIFVCQFYTFLGFLRARYRMGIFFGPQNYNFLGGMPDIPNTFWG